MVRAFAKKEGFSVNSQFSGHGIGRSFHQKPWILHHRELSPSSSTRQKGAQR
jgi:methionyl aminopeptidase